VGVPADPDPAHGRDDRNTPLPRSAARPSSAGTVARIIQARVASAGFAAQALGGHSLKRGALSPAWPAASTRAA